MSELPAGFRAVTYQAGDMGKKIRNCLNDREYSFR